MLRAFAALVVVFFHAGWKPFGNGFGGFGVDIFFVISGYIMTRICESSPQFFFRRRLIRVGPPYWLLTILLYFVVKFFPGLVDLTRAEPIFLLKSLLFIPLFKAPGDIQPILFLGWTLNFEMFFYVSVALGLLLFRRRPLVLASLIVATTTLACHIWIVLEFLIGAAVYYIAAFVPERSIRPFRVFFALAMGGSAVFLIAYQSLSMAGARLPLSVASFVMVLSAALLSKSGWDTNISWIVLAGDASYMLYLLHPYCISIFINQYT